MAASTREDTEPTPTWVQDIIRRVKEVTPREFVGQIEINVFKGAISHVNLKQSYRHEGATK